MEPTSHSGIMGSLGGSPSDYNKLEENKNVHHYIDAIENTVDISQLNDMSFGEETHSINETTGSMPQIHGKCRSSWLFDSCHNMYVYVKVQ